MSINYNEIFTKDFRSAFDGDYEERVIALKKEGIIERNKITKNGSRIGCIDHLTNRAIEYPNNSKHQHLTKVEKIILGGNILFEDESFSEYLLRFLAKYNYNSKLLKAYIKLLDSIKTAEEYGIEESIEEMYIKKANILTLQLKNYFKAAIGLKDVVYDYEYDGIRKPKHIDCSSLIINKINEILSFRPELLIPEQPLNNTITRRKGK